MRFKVQLLAMLCHLGIPHMGHIVPSTVSQGDERSSRGGRHPIPFREEFQCDWGPTGAIEICALLTAEDLLIGVPCSCTDGVLARHPLDTAWRPSGRSTFGAFISNHSERCCWVADSPLMQRVDCFQNARPVHVYVVPRRFLSENV
jgi:hypothetical protein